jgi:uncharacterized membrane protein YcaP (DUF421 family)
MDSVIRVVLMYLFLLLVFRLSGKRTLSEATTFDLLLMLVISETTQQAMVAHDHSLTHAFLLILTFMLMNLGLSLLKLRSARVERLLDDVPELLVQDGKALPDRLRRTRVDEHDILEAARELHGLESLDKVRYAVLERGGKISVIPR